jgi:hypothetical protein
MYKEKLASLTIACGGYSESKKILRNFLLRDNFGIDFFFCCINWLDMSARLIIKLPINKKKR